MYKLKQACLSSATIAWTYVIFVVSFFFEQLDSISDFLSSPELKDQVTELVGNPKLLGRVLFGISVMNMITRMRSLRKKNV